MNKIKLFKKLHIRFSFFCWLYQYYSIITNFVYHWKILFFFLGHHLLSSAVAATTKTTVRRLSFLYDNRLYYPRKWISRHMSSRLLLWWYKAHMISTFTCTNLKAHIKREVFVMYVCVWAHVTTKSGKTHVKIRTTSLTKNNK